MPVVLDVVKALARRWYVVLVGLILTVGLASAAYVATPSEYNARALVLLLPGSNTVGDGGNPFLALSGLEQPASIVVAYFSSESAQTEVADRWPTAEYRVLLDDSTRGPVISVDVTDTSAESTLATLDYLQNRIPEELARLQGEVDAPAASVITSMPLAVDAEASRDASATIRNVIAAVVVGLVLTGFAAFALDGILLRRRARRPAPPLPPTEDEFAEDAAATPPPKGHRRRRRTDAEAESAAADESTPADDGDPVEIQAGRGS